MTKCVRRLALFLLCSLPAGLAYGQVGDEPKPQAGEEPRAQAPPQAKAEPPAKDPAAEAKQELQKLSRQLDQLQQSGQFAEALPLAEQLTDGVRKVFGENSGEHAAMLARRAGLLASLTRYEEAEALYKRARDIATGTLGPEHAGVTFVLNDLALLYKQLGRYAEAEPLYLKAIAIREKALGADHPAVALVVSNLATLYVAQGRYNEAQPLFSRAIAITEKKLKPDHPEVAKNLNNLAMLYWALGRFSDAEPLYKRSLAIVESSLGAEHPTVSTALNNLAALYLDQGRHADAEALFQRALAIREKALGATHREVGESAGALAWFYHQALRRYADAEPLYVRAIAITEKALGSSHATVGAMLNNLAVLYHDQTRYAEAEPLFKRAIAVRQGALGPAHSDVGQTMYRLARLYHDQKRFAEARPLHRRALEIRRKAQGPDHPEVIQSLDGIAHMYEAQGNWTRAAAAARQARDLAVNRGRKSTLAVDTGALESGRREIAQRREVFARLVRVLWNMRQQQSARRALPLLSESYLGAHWAEQTEASAALAQMSVRQAKGEGSLSALVRERQDLARQWQALDKQLYVSVAQATGRNPEAERQLREQIAGLDSRRGAIDQTLQRDFSDYFVLANPVPVSVQETRKLLKPDEALLQFMVTDSDVFMWAISKNAERWERSSLDPKALAERVAALRCGLDYTAWDNDGACLEALKVSPRKEKTKVEEVTVLPFDVGRAHELYAALIEPVASVIAGKQLLVVASGPLASLPFHVLVTKRGKAAIPAKLADYRKVAWFGTRQSVTVLPSVDFLKSLRRYAKASRATKPYLGFGNPLLDGDQNHPQWGAYYRRLAQDARNNQSCDKRAPVQHNAFGQVASRSVGSFSSIFSGGSGQTSIAHLRQQVPLPETADELCDVASRLGVPSSEVLLGEQATEGRLKDLSQTGKLAEYSVLHFATHGALAGQVQGTAEPGLIFTPPAPQIDDAAALEIDDGYLAASEIATLKLDADWVILSACNTAGGSAGEASEALSGLARAFFYAGTRALLVSHWEVGSQAAVKLTTRAFAEIKARPSTGRAEALRVSMRELIEKGALSEAHPSKWAPFVVVGEGSRR